jgi:hypothetical protein
LFAPSSPVASWLQSGEIACDPKLDATGIAQPTPSPHPTTAKPVFVGHYWLSAEQPEVLADNVACHDFSVANSGFLCGYRWEGEQKLTSDNLVWVKADRAWPHRNAQIDAQSRA